jgi:hypothetical protein
VGIEKLTYLRKLHAILTKSVDRENDVKVS